MAEMVVVRPLFDDRPQAHLGKDNEKWRCTRDREELNCQGIEIGGAKIKFELFSEDDQPIQSKARSLLKIC